MDGWTSCERRIALRRWCERTAGRDFIARNPCDGAAVLGAWANAIAGAMLEENALAYLARNDRRETLLETGYQWTRTRYFRTEVALAATGTSNWAAKAAVLVNL